MKISLNWLADYLDVAPLRADLKGVLERLTMRGLEVESVCDLSKGFGRVIVAQLESCKKHPNADKLSVCQVHTGSEVLQIVCGAKNMKPGDKVALSLPGAELPNGAKIEKNQIRGVESYGMMCSEIELGLALESAGIMILPPDVPLGKPLAQVLGRDDVVFTINVTPNRGDVLSYIGIARELAALLDQKVRLPKVIIDESKKKTSEKIKVLFEEKVNNIDLCTQYHGRYLEGVKVGPSPQWLKQKLESVGLRSVNNIVDVTNFVLMEWGQPLHAFDYAKISNGEIHVRLARSGESIPLLDKTTIVLSSEDLVIVDRIRPVALAGVMGGSDSEVTEATTTVLLEAAQFLPSRVRRSARCYQKHTESSHRFERQVDPQAVILAQDRAVALMLEIAGGCVYSEAVSQFSLRGEQLCSKKNRHISILVPNTNQFLGTNLRVSQIQDCLNQVGFGVHGTRDQLLVEVPSYRPDVEIQEDVYEEILRVWGYDQVEARVPRLDFIPNSVGVAEQQMNQIEKIKLCFAEQGFSEAINFAFTSQKQNNTWGLRHQEQHVVHLENPLNEELTTLKTSLIGGLVENLICAQHHQEQNLRLFEIRPVYFKDPNVEQGVREEWRIAALICGRSFIHSLAARDRKVDFYDMKGVLEFVLQTLGVRGLCLSGWGKGSMDPRFHPTQTAQIMLGKKLSGVVGRLHPQLENENKFYDPVFVFEFSLEHAFECLQTKQKYSPIAKFPKVDRELSLIVPLEILAEKVIFTIQERGQPLLESVHVVDTYMGEKIPHKTRSLSVALVLSDKNRTLLDLEIEETLNRILLGLEKEIGVKLRVQ